MCVSIWARGKNDAKCVNRAHAIRSQAMMRKLYTLTNSIVVCVRYDFIPVYIYLFFFFLLVVLFAYLWCQNKVENSKSIFFFAFARKENLRERRVFFFGILVYVRTWLLISNILKRWSVSSICVCLSVNMCVCGHLSHWK